MATIPEPSLFCWDSVGQLGDLERLQLVLDALPDEPLMQLLEAGRGHGRNDYPVRPMWNSLIAGFVFQHPSIAALRRELLRNGQLRDRCGSIRSRARRRCQANRVRLFCDDHSGVEATWCLVGVRPAFAQPEAVSYDRMIV